MGRYIFRLNGCKKGAAQWGAAIRQSRMSQCPRIQTQAIARVHAQAPRRRAAHSSRHNLKQVGVASSRGRVAELSYLLVEVCAGQRRGSTTVSVSGGLRIERFIAAATAQARFGAEL